MELPARPAKVRAAMFLGSDRLATAGTDNAITIWDLKSRVPTHRLTGHTGTVTSLAWAPEAGWLVSGSYDATVRVWDIDAKNANQTAQSDPATTR